MEGGKQLLQDRAVLVESLRKLPLESDPPKILDWSLISHEKMGKLLKISKLHLGNFKN